MKSTLLLLFCLAFNIMPGPSALYGKWRLQKLDTGDKIMVPKVFTLFVMFSPANVLYNQDTVSRCTAKVISITDNTITLDDPFCAAPLNMDSISPYLEYSGTYTIHDSLLIIDN